jgi:RNA polymerase sigma-70 factor
VCRTPPGNLNAEGLYLSAACAAGDAAALHALVSRVLPRVRARLVRRKIPHDVIDDVLASLLERLLYPSNGRPPLFSMFAGRGSVEGWLLRIAYREAVAAQRAASIAEIPEMVAEDDPELDYVRRRYSGDVAAGLREALGSLQPEERQLLHEIHVEGLTVVEVSLRRRVHRVTVNRWLSTIRRRLRSRIEKAVASRLRLPKNEVRELVLLLVIGLVACGPADSAETVSKDSAPLAASTLSDDFDDGVIDASKWTATGDVSESSGQLRLTSGSSSGYATLASNATYDFSSSTASIEWVTAGTSGTNHGEWVMLQKDANDDVELFLYSGRLHARKKVNGTVTTLCDAPYVASTMRFVRLRGASKKTYFEYSSDSASWTTMCNVSNPFSVTSLRLVLTSGNWGSATPTTAVFDNLNRPPPAASYYVSPSGSDGNSGRSPSNAWKTIAKVDSVAFADGETILFEGGSTFDGTLQFDAGDRGKTTIGSYGTGRATIRGLFIWNRGSFTADNIDVVANGTNPKSGVIVWGDQTNATYDDIRIKNVTTSGFTEYGIYVASGTSTTIYRNVSIENVTAHDNELGGVFTWATAPKMLQNVRIANTVAYANPGKVGLSQPSGSGITMSGVDGGTIEYCVAHHNGANNTNSAGPVGIWAYASNDVKIQYSESYSNKTNGGDGDGFDLDGGTTNSVMQYNYSHDNDGVGYLLAQYDGAGAFDNNTIRYNISRDDCRKMPCGAITVWGASDTFKPANAEVYDNTLFMSQGPNPYVSGIALWSWFSGIRFRNNAIVVASGLPVVDGSSAHSPLASVLFQQNAYWASGGAFKTRWAAVDYTSLASWRSAGQEPSNSGMFVDPKLDAALKLLPGSPLIDAGLGLGFDMGTHDYWGGAIPLGTTYDVGAHEGG